MKDKEWVSKQKIKNSFDNLLISFQEEATSKHSSEEERRIYSKIYVEVSNEMKRLKL